MIRARDVVRIQGKARGVVETIAAGAAMVRVPGSGLFAFKDGDLEILCSNGCLPNGAVAFVRSTGEAVCAKCVERKYHSHEIVETRGAPDMIVACKCGESLDGAQSHGVLTIGETVCEYRYCANCHSSRPYLVDVVKHRKVGLYLDVDTSEVEVEWDGLLDALLDEGLEGADVDAGAELRRNGDVLARCIVGPTGAKVWLVEKPRRG